MDKGAPCNAKYKSKDCVTFQEKLFCPYGRRCLFRHDDRTLASVKEFHHLLRMTVCPRQTLMPILKESGVSEATGRKRLPVFEQIC